MNEENKAAICVIGSSMMGKSLAKHLIEANMEVIVIDDDDHMSVGDFVIDEQHRWFKSVLDIKMAESIAIDKKQQKRLKKEQDKWFLKRLGK